MTIGKSESIVVGLFLGIACPFLLFVLFWWSTALLHMRVPGFPLSVVIAAALTGLVLGVLLDVFLLKRWVRQFYTANLRSMIILYLALSVLAFASFMGLPVGTIAIGTLAGVYMGRRASHAHTGRSRTIPALRATALVTALVTALAALPIGLLALREKDILENLERISGISRTSLQGAVGFALIIFLCGLLFLIQYSLSRIAGFLAWNTGEKNSPRTASEDRTVHLQ